MHLPKLIVSDLDGTLLPESKIMTARTRDVLQRLMRHGVRVSLATGKFLHLTKPYGETLGTDVPLVALDGARVGGCNGNGATAERGIPREVVVDLLEHTRPDDLDVFLDDGADEMLLRYRNERFTWATRYWANRTRRVDDLREHLVGDPGIVALYGPKDTMCEVHRTCTERYPDVRVSLFDSALMPDYGRITFQPGAVNKGSAVRQLCERLDVAPEECWVFGDWHNDVPLFEAGCVNVAMANAVEPVKARAHHVTTHDCENEGVADFLERSLL